MQEAYDFFYELFLSDSFLSLFGPFAVIMIGYFLVKKSAVLGVFWFVVECLMIAQYLDLVNETPDYWWQVILLLLGGLATCVFPLIDRKR